MKKMVYASLFVASWIYGMERTVESSVYCCHNNQQVEDNEVVSLARALASFILKENFKDITYSQPLVDISSLLPVQLPLHPFYALSNAFNSLQARKSLEFRDKVSVILGIFIAFSNHLRYKKVLLLENVLACRPKNGHIANTHFLKLLKSFLESNDLTNIQRFSSDKNTGDFLLLTESIKNKISSTFCKEGARYYKCKFIFNEADCNYPLDLAIATNCSIALTFFLSVPTIVLSMTGKDKVNTLKVALSYRALESVVILLESLSFRNTFSQEDILLLEDMLTLSLKNNVKASLQAVLALLKKTVPSLRYQQMLEKFVLHAFKIGCSSSLIYTLCDEFPNHIDTSQFSLFFQLIYAIIQFERNNHKTADLIEQISSPSVEHQAPMGLVSHEEIMGMVRLIKEQSLPMRQHLASQFLLIINTLPYDKKESLLTELLCAVACLEYEEWVTILMNNGAGISLGNDSSLHYAAEIGNIYMVKLCLRKGVNPDIGNRHGRTPLMVAVEAGQEEVVKYLIEEAKVNIHRCSPIGQESLIFIAAHNGYTRLVTYLIKQGVNPLIPDCTGCTSLSMAMRNGCSDIVKLLLNYPWSHEDKIKALRGAISNGQEDTVAIFLERNPDDIDISVVDSQGNTIFHDAARSGNKSVMKMLLWLFDAYTKNAKMSESSSLLNSVTRLLLSTFVKNSLNTRGLEVQNNEGLSPIDIAINAGNDNMVRLLIKYTFSQQTQKAIFERALLSTPGIYELIVKPFLKTDKNTKLVSHLHIDNYFTRMLLAADKSLFKACCYFIYAGFTFSQLFIVLHRKQISLEEIKKTFRELIAEFSFKEKLCKVIEDKDMLHLKSLVKVISLDIDQNILAKNGISSELCAQIFKDMALCFKNERGDTPLHLAVLSYKEAIKLLFYMNPYFVVIQNNQGKTPVELAVENIHILKSFFDKSFKFSETSLAIAHAHLQFLERIGPLD